MYSNRSKDKKMVHQHIFELLKFNCEKNSFSFFKHIVLIILETILFKIFHSCTQ